MTLTPLGETLLNLFLILILYVGLGTFFTLMGLLMAGIWPKRKVTPPLTPPKGLTDTTEVSDDQQH